MLSRKCLNTIAFAVSPFLSSPSAAGLHRPGREFSDSTRRLARDALRKLRTRTDEDVEMWARRIANDIADIND